MLITLVLRRCHLTYEDSLWMLTSLTQRNLLIASLAPFWSLEACETVLNLDSSSFSDDVQVMVSLKHPGQVSQSRLV